MKENKANLSLFGGLWPIESGQMSEIDVWKARQRFESDYQVL
jgi:hypothetical protein